MDSPTTVPSIRGRTCGRLTSQRNNFGELFECSAMWTSFKMDPCTGRLDWWLVGQYSRSECHGRHLIILKAIGNSMSRYFWSNVKARLDRGKKDSGQVIGNSSNVSTDRKYRIYYIPHLSIHFNAFCEINIIVMNCSSTWICAHHVNIPKSKWTRSLRRIRRQTKVQGTLKRKWIVRRLATQTIMAHYWALLSTCWIINLTISISKCLGCGWMPSQ